MFIDIDETYKNIIQIELDKEVVTPEEVDWLNEIVKEVIDKKYKRVNFLILIENHKTNSLEIILETIKMNKHSHKSIGKVAIIVHGVCIKSSIKQDAFAFPWKEKYFDIDNQDEAWQWLTHKQKP